MYSAPLVGPVEPIVVNAAPATPAMPQPMAKVRRSVWRVLMPAALAIGRFSVVARTRSPQRDRYSASQTRPATQSVSAITNRPLMGMSSPGAGDQEPISQSGRVGLTSLGPKMERKACCMPSDSPQVASRVSRGRL
ncbi:hypothetical protein D3C86_1708610 [compost metagenome]